MFAENYCRDMPKPIKFTKDIIIRTCLNIVESQGSEALTARSICKKMGCSVAPLFRTFKNMDELIAGARDAAEDIYRINMEDTVYYTPAFKEFGIRMIRFSKERPQLFRFLFLEINGRNNLADSIARECLKQTERDFSLTVDEANHVYDLMWPTLLGYSQLCCTDSELYTEEHISRLLSLHFAALIRLLKSKEEVIIKEPVLNASELK